MAMNGMHSTLPRLLASFSRNWTGRATESADLRQTLLTEPFRFQTSATLSHLLDYSTSGSATVHRGIGTEGCRAFADYTFCKVNGGISAQPRNPSCKILHAGTFAIKGEWRKTLDSKPWQYDRCQKQLWTLSSIAPGLSSYFNVSTSRASRDSKAFMIIPKETARGFAKTVAVAPNMQKPMKLRLYMGSPGVIGEPYKKPPPPLPFFRRWFTREGWKRRKGSFMGMIKTSYTIAKLRQKTKGYSQQRFYQEASDLYRQVNVALAEGERTTLRQLVTDNVFSLMKNELKHRENSWAKVKWEMVGPINKIRTLQDWS